MRGRIDLLRRSGLAAGAVSIQLRGFAGSLDYDALHHGAHLGRRQLLDHAVRAVRQRCWKLVRGTEGRGLQPRVALVLIGGLQQDVRRHVHAAIGDCAHHGYKLNGRHAHLLPDGERQNAGRAPLSGIGQQTARLTGQLDARAVAEAEGLDVFVESLRADLQRHLGRAHVTRML